MVKREREPPLDENDNDVDDFLLSEESDSEEEYVSKTERKRLERAENAIGLSHSHDPRLEVNESVTLSEDEGSSADETESKLIQEALESKGANFFRIADDVHEYHSRGFISQRVRCSRLSPTCMALSSDERVAVVGSKDQSVNVFDVEKNKRVHSFLGIRSGDSPDVSKGHHGHVLCCCIGEDGRLAFSGGADKYIKVWDLRSKRHLVTSMKGHRNAVTGVVYAPNSSDLYSCSADRSVKVWSLSNFLYVDTLFGHEASVAGISSVASGLALTGGSDRTLRLWKVNEDSQLIFRGHNASIDCVTFVTSSHFISGSEDGSLALWSRLKRKPVLYIHDAHDENRRKRDVHPNPISSSPLWVSSVASIVRSDLVASGSADGRIMLWKCTENLLEFVNYIDAPGYVNGLQFGSSKRVLASVQGQEHRLGRWHRLTGAKNVFTITRLPYE
ncbi:U3 small nucleolar RNA-interacting protein 2 [Galdieria sulphuraria]|uniref:Nucleic acid binding protein n=1 Tax=Galdieria sulphuraria TaxID=130081 RepID=M2WXX3_GALSU|nr:nucleic acid binding protein [Galdieria sulphuraria]EME28905.1 nucleic acid binding protein [Galdieria sulphuraria]GJD08294.1 U3 small nucleolar RNA-interacting protein 2 [Galdieria sulphuraria]|eukprot:XP_005705425.1 nucleic acid binding protein [Galdieria sulphuraria]